MDVLASLYLNVADYFERGYRQWKAAIECGDPLAFVPRWVETYQGNLEAAKYWREKAVEHGGVDGRTD
jgi:hypothetical protein